MIQTTKEDSFHKQVQLAHHYGKDIESGFGGLGVAWCL